MAYSGPVYTMDDESWTMEDGLFHGPIYLKKIYKAFGPLTTCKPNVDQEEWP